MMELIAGFQTRRLIHLSMTLKIADLYQQTKSAVFCEGLGDVNLPE